MLSDINYPIRLALTTDAARLSALCMKTFTDTYAAYNTPENMRAYLEDHFTADHVEREIDDPQTFIFVSQYEDQLTGYIMLKICEPPIEIGPGKFMEIARFYVDSAYQGRQMGGLLMQTALQWSRNLGFEMIWLTVWKQNTRAVSIYDHLGFTISGETIFKLGDDLQVDHVMTKKL